MSEHKRAAELLTWQVIGRLGGEDLDWLLAHLEGCAHCRAEQRAQRRIRDAVASQPVIEFAPQASFNRLWQQIESDANIDNPHAATAPAGSPIGTPRGARAHGWLKGLVAAQAAAIVLLGGALWQWQHRPVAADYHTVSTPSAPPSARYEIKVIFADQMRVADLKGILATTGLLVAAGPNSAGVYTLISAETDTREAAQAALPRLRADPRVRFAELSSHDTYVPQAR
jgi:hypothetical protein